MASLNARIEKIRTRAAKIAKHGALAESAAAIGVTVTGTEVVYRCVNCESLGGCECWAPGQATEYTLVQVAGHAPRLAGWAFAAKIEHISEEGIGNLVKADPNVTLPEGALVKYRTVGSDCDHCKVTRRRRDTYIVSHTDGRTAQVGSTCIGDFLGGEGPAAAALAELRSEVGGLCEESEGGGGGGRGRLTCALHTFLAVVCAVARESGWLSRSKARELEEQGQDSRPATASIAWDVMFPSTEYWRKEARRVLALVTEADKAFAEAAIEAAKEISADTTSDYEYNLRVVALVPLIDSRMMGLAASLYAWHRRNIDAARERVARPVSKHVGTVGERAERELILFKVVHVDTDYGTLHIHMFNDAEGNVLLWKTTSASLDEGAYRVKATVKKHGEYKGALQTEISRADCEELVGPCRIGVVAPPAKKARSKKAA